MPKTRVVIFQEDDGSVPLNEWLDELKPKAQDKVLARIVLLEQSGHDLRRPHADLLRNGIYELRAKHENVNLRVLYFFHGREAVVLSHGFSKQASKVPKNEIEDAIIRRKTFLAHPDAHTYKGEENS